MAVSHSTTEPASDDAMSISLSTMDQSTTVNAAPGPPPSYRFFLSSHASPSLFSVDVAAPPIPEGWSPPLPTQLKLHQHPAQGAATQPLSSAGIQRSVGAWVGNGQDRLWVLAVARKDATIDVILPPPSPHAASADDRPSSSSPDAALRLASIKEDRMRVGMERWVGLTLGSSGIYSCTSSGAFRFVPLAVLSISPPSLAVGEARTLSLLGPLQHLAFHHGAGPSSSSDPTHFAFGGEEVPLSLYDIGVALFGAPAGSASDDDNGNAQGTGAREDEEQENGTPTASQGGDGLTSKQRKRKRIAEARAKNKELNPGEIWRAKNLPNDALSLPQRANITSVVFLPPSRGNEGARSNVPSLRILTGTKDGKVRIYEPSSGVRKHRSEADVAEKGKGPIKVAISVADVVVGGARDDVAAAATEGQHTGEGDENERRAEDDEVIFADASGRLGVYDTEEGKLRFTYKDITGAITSAVLLPPPSVDPSSSSSATSAAPPRAPLLLTSSLDSLLRLHSLSTYVLPRSSRTPIPARATGRHAPRKAGKTLACFLSGTGSAGLGNVGSIVWDGVTPVISEDDAAAVGGGDKGRGKGHAATRHDEDGEEDEDEEDEEEEVWQGMKTVGDREMGRGAREEAEEEDDDKEARGRESKRRRD